MAPPLMVAQKTTRRAARAPFHCMLLLAAALALAASVAAAKSVEFERARVALHEQALALDADLAVRLSESVASALHNGVKLVFVTSVQVVRERPLWRRNDYLVDLELRKRLGYHALTKKYILDDLTGGARKSFSSLAGALKHLGRYRKVHVIDATIARSLDDAVVRMRLRLSRRDLPLPLRLKAMVSPSWRLASEWFAWKLN